MEARQLKINACKGVYECREDSYMLASIVEKYAFGKALDLGTGTGIQGITAAMKGCSVTFSDIDTRALECARINAASNNVNGKFIHSDMFDGIGDRFNTIIFNPPYVASKDKKHIALDGGDNGREYIDRLISSYKDYVMEKHVVLLVESSFNRYERDIRKLKAKIMAKGHYFFEDIVVLLF